MHRSLVETRRKGERTPRAGESSESRPMALIPGRRIEERNGIEPDRAHFFTSVAEVVGLTGPARRAKGLSADPVGGSLALHFT
jgi:hypothetical protein